MRAQFCLAPELKRVSSENEGEGGRRQNPSKLVPPVKLQINPFSPRGITIEQSKFLLPLPLFGGIKRVDIRFRISRAKKEKREIRKRRKRAGRLSSGVNLGQIENSRGSTAQFVFLRLPEKMGRRGREERPLVDPFQKIGKRGLSSRSQLQVQVNTKTHRCFLIFLQRTQVLIQRGRLYLL